ncbi:hypothetical protein B0T25DRAFT_592591 [Lasiosphaeria hispida]|uniref:Uncharacterized protein n=1 Tax=Lasiosphaeria hispida TaxID=260671 RepID=A0AAJ0MAR3_9PEZI|nr:hypothetical protein B0T25DRAFT_592591 [Lasiosphaeria hispida]
MSPSLEANAVFRVDGMVAVITGGGTGIGLIMARALAANGAAKVYILGRRLEVLENAAKENPDVFVPIRCDVTSKDSLQAAVDRVTAEAGFVNLFVANSGILGPLNKWNPSKSVSEVRRELFTDNSMEAMTEVFHVNVTGAFFSMVAFLELLDAGNKNAVEKGGFGAPTKAGSNVPSVQSQVIVTASIAAFSRMNVSTAPYSGSKAAIMHLTKHASTNMAVYGIRANALAPGLFPSELAASLIGTRNPAEETYQDPKFIPARKFGGDEEMAGTVLYLASRAGSFCNGMVLAADGGRMSVMTTTY